MACRGRRAGSESYSPPSKSAIFQARARLGSEPLAALFARVAKPIGPVTMPGAWLAGRRLVAIDGTCLDVADTRANDEHFGRPGVNKGEQAAFPQARVVALAECGTHAIFAADDRRVQQTPRPRSPRAVGSPAPGMLLLADRGFFSLCLVAQGIATGADLLWRVSTGRNGPKPTHLEDPSRRVLAGASACRARTRTASRCWSGLSTTRSMTAGTTPAATDCSPP